MLEAGARGKQGPRSRRRDRARGDGHGSEGCSEVVAGGGGERRYRQIRRRCGNREHASMAEMGARQAEQAVSTMAETTRAASQSVQPLIRSFSVFSEMPGMSLSLAKDVGEVWSDLLKKNLETSARASQEMFRLTSPQQVVRSPAPFSCGVSADLDGSGSRMMEISLRASSGMKSAVQEAAKEAKKAAPTGR